MDLGSRFEGWSKKKKVLIIFVIIFLMVGLSRGIELILPSTPEHSVIRNYNTRVEVQIRYFQSLENRDPGSAGDYYFTVQVGEKENQYLFEISAKGIEKALDINEIPEELKRKFKNEEISITKYANVTMDGNNKWKITDVGTGSIFLVRRKNDNLRIFKSGKSPTYYDHGEIFYPLTFMADITENKTKQGQVDVTISVWDADSEKDEQIDINRAPTQKSFEVSYPEFARGGHMEASEYKKTISGADLEVNLKLKITTYYSTIASIEREENKSIH